MGYQSIQKENDAPSGLEARVEENGEEVSPPHSTWGLGERRKLFQWGPGWNHGRKRFYCNLRIDRLCWQQVTANSSPFRPEKWGYGTSQSKSGGTGTPRTPVNYAYENTANYKQYTVIF